MKMKAAVWHKPMDLRVEMVDIPEIGPDDVLLKVIACGICGSDVHSYRLGSYIKPGQIMGHELVGRIEKIGENFKGKGFEVGDRVFAISVDFCGECYWCKRGMIVLCPMMFEACLGYGKQGAFAEYVRIDNPIPGATIAKLPDSIDDYSAATIEPLGVAAITVANAKPQEGDTAVILGAGMIGNGIMQILKNSTGVSKVVVSEVSEVRLEAAKKLGADVVINATKENVLERCKQEVGIGRYHFNEGAMADLVVEAAGASSTIWDAFEIVRSAGTIAFVGLPEKPALIDTTKIVHKAPTIVGALGGDSMRAIELLKDGIVNCKDLVSHVFSLDDAVEAFETQCDPNKSIKVLITP